VDRDQQSSQSGSTRTTPPKGGESKAKPKASASRAKGSGENPAGTTAPDIMSRLPKTRPQRASQRRRATSGDAPPKTRATRGAAQAATASRKPATAKRPASTSQRRAAATPRPAARPATSGPQSQAPGLPRLAIDGAAEAVKLPLKVSGRLTLRALDAVARGLRRR
jgi:hypothetical protein